TTDIFERDLVHNLTLVVSKNATNSSTGDVASPTYPGNGGRLALSADGRFVAFDSLANDLVAGFVDGNGGGGSDVFLRDTAAGTPTLVSVNAPGQASGNYYSGELVGSIAMSADGRFIAFQSGANNLVAGESGGLVGSTYNVFLRDVTAGTTTLV